MSSALEQPATVLVTGASGFIGKHLVDHLVELNYDVLAQVQPSASLRALACRTAIGDLNDPAFARRIVTAKNVVIHLASESSAASFGTAPGKALARDYYSILNVLSGCSAEVRRVVYVSSAQVYGSDHSSPVREDCPVRATSLYAASKITGETLTQAFCAANGPSYVILRLSNVFGPCQPARALIPEIILSAVRNGHVQVRTTKPIRDFVYVRDVVEAVTAAAALPQAQNEIFNVGSGVGRSVGEVAREIELALSRDFKRKPTMFEPKQDSEGVNRVDTLVLDPSKAMDLLGWRARVSFQHGLKQCIESSLEEADE